MKTKFSIVVPVYNTDFALLNRCLDSILNQTYDCFECILVDDGSEKDYIKQLENICAKDKRISLNLLEHNGNSYARNYGISVADSDYLMFVDSDDVIPLYMLEEAEKAIGKYNPDMVMGLVKAFEGDHIDFVQSDESIFDKAELYKSNNEIGDVFEHILGDKKSNLMFSDGYISGGPVARAIKTDIVKKCLFPGGNLLTEDVIWNCVMMSYLNTLVLIPEIWYGYFHYSGSKSRKYYSNGIQMFNEQVDAYCKYIGLHWPDRKNGLYMKLWQEIAMFFRTYLNDKSIKWSDRYRIYKDIFKKPEYVSTIDNIDFSYEKSTIKRFIKKTTRNLIKCHLYLPTWFIWKYVSNKSF